MNEWNNKVYKCIDEGGDHDNTFLFNMETDIVIKVYYALDIKWLIHKWLTQKLASGFSFRYWSFTVW